MANQKPQAASVTDDIASGNDAVSEHAYSYQRPQKIIRKKSKQKFKQTEVGLIPEDWESKPLGELVRITSGASPSLFRFVSNGIPYFKVEQLSNAEKYLDSTTTPYRFKSGNTVSGQSVSFAKRGAAILLNKVRIMNEAFFMDTNLMALTPQNELDCEYLYYSLGHIGIWRFADTTSVPQINNKHVNPLPFPLPSLPEQQAIASALSDVDELLGALDRLIAKKRDLKQAAMQELLTGKRRLLGFTKPWETKTLGEVFVKVIGGGTPSRSNESYWNGHLPWVTVKDFTTFDPYHTQEYITEEGLSNSATHLIPARIPIISTRMALGKIVLYEVAVTINQDLKALFLNGNLEVKFFVYWFKKHSSDLESLGSGSTVQGISLVDLRKIPIRLPIDTTEQTAIASILYDMDEEIAVLESRREKTRLLKQGMMQELLTGRIRLVEPALVNIMGNHEEKKVTFEAEPKAKKVDTLQGVMHSFFQKDDEPASLSIDSKTLNETPTGEIQLYLDQIQQTAFRRLEITPLNINSREAVACCFLMVLRHEMVHAACHLGRFEDGSRWPFESMSTEVHETLAELFKDQSWSDPFDNEVLIELAHNASGYLTRHIYGWYMRWHEEQQFLPPDNPYRQHLLLRQSNDMHYTMGEASKERIAETVEKLVAAYTAPSKKKLKGKPVQPLEPSILKSWLESIPLIYSPEDIKQYLEDGVHSIDLPAEGKVLGSVCLEGTGLLELLGFDQSAIKGDGVTIKVFNRKPKNVKLPTQKESIPLTRENLERLCNWLKNQDQIMEAWNDRHNWDKPPEKKLEIPRKMWAELMAAKEFRNHARGAKDTFHKLQERPWDLRLFSKPYGMMGAILEVGIGEGEEISSLPERVIKKNNGNHLAWQSDLARWKNGDEDERQMLKWIQGLEKKLEVIKKIMRRYAKEANLIPMPAIETLGAYVSKPGDKQ